MAEIVLLVSGSRSIKDYSLVEKACDTFVCEACLRFAEKVEIKLLKHGDAPGVDRLCEMWAKRHGIEPVPFPAKWDDWEGLPPEKISLKRNRFGKHYNVLAGFNRNQEMIDSGFDVLLAIRCLGKSSGTDDQIERVMKLDKPIFIYRENGSFEWLIPNQKN